MGIYLPNVYMPKDDKALTIQICPDGSIWQQYRGTVPNAKAVHVPPHGRLIDADKLHKATYHRAFETDGDTMWQSGCWVRYRAIEQVQDSQPTIIEAEEET